MKKNHYKAKLFTGDTSPAAVEKLSDAANEEKSAVAAGKGKAPMPAPKKTPTQSQPGSSADHAQLPPEDTNEDLHTTALGAVPEEEGEERGRRRRTQISHHRRWRWKRYLLTPPQLRQRRS